MKIIVTGALGFIGSKLIRDLAMNLKDAEIHMIDNLLTQRYFSLFDLPNKNKYFFYEKDLIKDDVNNIFLNSDVAIHLAALTEASSSYFNPKEYETQNYLGTEKILDLCKINNVKLIHFSSTSVYGTNKMLVDEDSGIEDLKPQSPYAETKLKEEILVKDYFEKGFVETRTLRLGSICGVSPGMRFHGAISKFCYQASIGSPITVWKTALNQKRPFLHIQDAINAIIFVVEKNLFGGGLFNVVTSNFSVNQIINEIKKNIDSVKIELIDSKIMNKYSYDVSAQKIINQGYSFHNSISSGIEDTLNLFHSLQK